MVAILNEIGEFREKSNEFKHRMIVNYASRFLRLKHTATLKANYERFLGGPVNKEDRDRVPGSENSSRQDSCKKL